jgi:hypothetical protein
MFKYFAGAVFRAMTKDGRSLYDLCDPLLFCHRGDDQHLAKFHKTALGNPALRPLLWRAGPELGDERRFRSLQAALTSARNDACVRWQILVWTNQICYLSRTTEAGTALETGTPRRLAAQSVALSASRPVRLKPL